MSLLCHHQVVLLLLLVTSVVNVVVAFNEDSITTTSEDGPCNSWPPVCSQLCNNETLNAADRCSCVDGYELDTDRVKCKPQPWSIPGTWLVYAEGEYIKLLNYSLLQQSSRKVWTKTLYNNDNYKITALDVNIADREVYFVDEFEDGYLAIKSVKIDEQRLQQDEIVTEADTLIVNGVHSVQSLAIDWVGQNIFLADEQEIVACSIKTRHCTTVVKDNIDQQQRLQSIAIDAPNGRLYWSECSSSSGRLLTSALDGSNQRVLTEGDSVGCVRSLHLDLPLNHLYFINDYYKSIEVYNLNATTQQHKTFRISSDLTGCASVVTSDDDLLFSMKATQQDRDSSSFMDSYSDSDEDLTLFSINKVNKFEEDGETVLPISLADVPMSLRVLNGGVQTTKLKPCEQLTCSHICLLHSASSAVCTCPSGLQLDRSGQHCTVDWSHPSIVFTHNNEILHVALDYIGGLASNVIHTADSNISAMAYDWTIKTLYFSVDTAAAADIYRMNLDSHVLDKLFHDVAAGVMDLEVDLASHNIYWISREQARVTVGRSDGTLTTVLTTTPVATSEHYSAISIDSDHHKLYYSLCGSTSSHIGVCSLTGADCSVILQLNSCPRGLHMDSSSDEIYFTDPKNFRIMKVTVDTKRESFLKMSSSANAISTTSEYFLWSSSQQAEINFMSKRNSLAKLGVIRTGRTGLGALCVIGGPEQTGTVSSSCSINNGDCSELCVPATDDKSHVCLCSTGNTCEQELLHEQKLSPVVGGTTSSSINSRQSTVTRSTAVSDTSKQADCSNYCINAGTCYINDKGNRMCRCKTSETGDRCEVTSEQTATLVPTEPPMFDIVHVWLAVVLAALVLVIATIAAIACYIKRRRRLANSRDDEVQIKYAADSHQQSDVKPMIQESSFTEDVAPFTIPRPKFVVRDNAYVQSR